MIFRPHSLCNQLLVGVIACWGGWVQAEEEGAAESRSERPQAKVERIGDGKFRLGKIGFDQKTREITLSAKVNMNLGYLEYVLVNEMIGKIHESLLITDASPLNLNVVLLLLGYQASMALEQDEQDEEDKAIGPQPKASMDILVRWKDKGGVQKEVYIENWINNLATDAPASRGHWLYTGSKVDRDYGGFAAETDGSFIAVYRDHRAILNNPRAGKTSDEIWKPAPQPRLPAKDTPVVVVFRAHGREKKESTAGAAAPSCP